VLLQDAHKLHDVDILTGSDGDVVCVTRTGWRFTFEVVKTIGLLECTDVHESPPVIASRDADGTLID
jgi:hypothetical protein